MTTKIGALWLKTTPRGEKYMSGQIELNGEKIRFAVFKNTKKELEKQPDYNILLSGQQNQPQSPPSQPQSLSGSPGPEREIRIEDIPF